MVPPGLIYWNASEYGIDFGQGCVVGNGHEALRCSSKHSSGPGARAVCPMHFRLSARLSVRAAKNGDSHLLVIIVGSTLLLQ
jgi:hypothetical protein